MSLAALSVFDAVGLLGTTCVLLAYFLLQAGRLDGNGLRYQWLNLLGAGGVLASLAGKFNLSVFVLEGIWVLISGYGIARTLSRRRAAARALRD